MCGLSGAMSSSLSYPELGMFKDIMNVSSLRGPQGSGVIVCQQPTRKSTVRTLRYKGIAGGLAYSTDLDDLFKPRVNCVIGHARLPTKGGTELDALHPHRFGHITGVHNGTMWKVNDQFLKDKQSDSAELFKSFAENGVIETIKKSSGAYALIWIDEKDQTINFLRNSQRTLFFKNVGWEKNVNTMYWASEAEMLDFVFARSFKGTNVWTGFLPVDTWYKYPLDVNHRIRPLEVVENVRPLAYGTQTNSTQRRGGTANDNQIWGDEDFEDFFRNGGDTGGLPWVNGRPVRPKGNVICLPAPAKTGRELSAMSRQARKHYIRDRKEKERDVARRIEAFRRVDTLLAKKQKEEAQLKDLRPQLTELAEDEPAYQPDRYRPSVVPDTDPVRSPDVGSLWEQHLGVDPRERAPCKVVGQACCWCGDAADIGSPIYIVSGGDLGGNTTFLCDDCGQSEYAQDYARGARLGVAVKDVH